MFDESKVGDQIKQVVSLLGTAAKKMAGSDGDEYRQALAQIAMKQYNDFREVGFKASEALALTCVSLKGGAGDSK